MSRVSSLPRTMKTSPVRLLRARCADEGFATAGSAGGRRSHRLVTVLVFAVGLSERAVPSPLVEVRVLGLVELFDGTSVVRLRRAEQTLLAALAARVGERVPVDVLVEALWPAGRPPSARKTLQGHILRLRRAVGPAAIVERDGGYRLDPELVEIDATRVTRLVAAAREALRRGDAEVAIGLLGEVNEAFRGEPYEGVPDTAVPAGEVQRLVELRVAVVEDSAEAQLDRGQGERCIGELEAFAQANPYRERAWGLLMRALYQAGRPADALAAFGRARVLLAAELGIEPGPALRDVEQAILTHDPRLAPTAAASPDPVRSNPPAVQGAVGDVRSPPFAILGKLEVRSRAGAEQVAGRRRRQLLAYLLVNAGGRVSIDGICDAVWEGAPPSGAAATVRTYISQFRRFDVDGPSLAIDADGSGYDIGLDRAGLDSTCFEDRFRGSGPLEGYDRLEALESALALWRGPALVEFLGAEWADLEASRLERLREVAVKERFDTLLALGRHSDCLADLADRGRSCPARRAALGAAGPRPIESSRDLQRGSMPSAARLIRQVRVFGVIRVPHGTCRHETIGCSDALRCERSTPPIDAATVNVHNR